ncbi:hypothetical protein ETH_00040395, partial [Eimeria tenella]
GSFADRAAGRKRQGPSQPQGPARRKQQQIVVGPPNSKRVLQGPGAPSGGPSGATPGGPSGAPRRAP